MAKTEKSVSELTYEQAFGELEDIILVMEGEQQTLENSVKMFERGQALAKRCTELLDNAELRIKELTNTKNSVTNEE